MRTAFARYVRFCFYHLLPTQNSDFLTGAVTSTARYFAIKNTSIAYTDSLKILYIATDDDKEKAQLWADDIKLYY